MDSKVRKNIDLDFDEHNVVKEGQIYKTINDLSFNQETGRAVNDRLCYNPIILKIHLLPIEIILEIISYLDEIEDILNCMLLCKQIRVLMYKTPIIMRKIVIAADLDDSMNLSFLKKRGKYIRNLKIERHNFKSIGLRELPSLLSRVPNLEELTYKNELPRTIKLPELKHLKRIKSGGLCPRCFLTEKVNIKNLETLRIQINGLEDAKLFTNFLCRQIMLKELTIVEKFGHQNFFLVRDISNELQFKLTKFVYSLDDCSAIFLKFLKHQAENLKELDIGVNLNYNVLNTIFTKCKILEKLTVSSNCQFTTEDPRCWVLKSLKHFRGQSTSSVDLHLIYKKFPNLISLHCSDIVPCEGTFHKLETFYMSSPLDCRKLINFKLPNLRKLVVKSVEGNIWKHFKRNFPKIEKLAFVGHCSDFFTIVRSLNYFQNMKSFEHIWQERNNYYLTLSIDFTRGIFNYVSTHYDIKTIGYLNLKYQNFRRFEASWTSVSHDNLYRF